MTTWFDVEDLFYYVRSGNARMSGIQRLTYEIYQAAHASGGATGKVRFVRHGRGQSLVPIEWDEVAAEFGPRPALARAASTPAGPQPASRRPLADASLKQAQAAAALARFSAAALAMPVAAALHQAQRSTRALAGRARAASPSFDALAKPGDTLLVLGAPWFRTEYATLARTLRDDRRMRFGVLVHDLVPMRHPEWCHAGVTQTVKDWYASVLPFCDLVLANSRHTAQDLESYARETAITLPTPVIPLPIGTGFGPPAPDPAPLLNLPAPGTYVLFVSTLEARKNHALAVRIWRALLAEVRAGTRAPGTVPDLVFAGRIGWLVGDLLEQLDNTNWLGGRIRMVHSPSDAELRALYAGCLFTIFPSFHEGWGLPVTESLAFGKPCLASNAAALPEAGGPLCRYFDPEDAPAAAAAAAAVLDDRPGLAAWEAEVRRTFRPTPWSTTAQTLLDAVAALDK